MSTLRNRKAVYEINRRRRAARIDFLLGLISSLFVVWAMGIAILLAFSVSAIAP